MCLAAVTLGACGGSVASSSNVTQTEKADPSAALSGDTVAQVGSLGIAKPMLNQWMTIELAADYYAVSKREAPEALVLEPPNYPACIAAVRRMPATPGKGKRASRLTTAQLRSKCEQLYQAIKAQTLTFLVGADWIINFDAHHGITVSDQEVGQSLKRVQAEQYPRPGQFQTSLNVRRRTLGEETYLAKIALLQRKLQQRIQGGNPKQASVAKEVSSTANIAVCREGYVVVRCKQFKGGGYTGPSPSALLEGIAR
jgi:hypothetical protein